MAFALGDTESVSQTFAFSPSCSPHMPSRCGSGVGLRHRHFWIETRSLKQPSNSHSLIFLSLSLSSLYLSPFIFITLYLSRFLYLTLTLTLSISLSDCCFLFVILSSPSLTYSPLHTVSLSLPKRKQECGARLGGMA